MRTSVNLTNKQHVAVPESKNGFETPQDPISSIQETISSDVVVVGGGIAGTSAALSAAEQGAKTILLEKTGSCQGRGFQFAAIGSRLQKRLGIEIDRDEVILNFMKLSLNKPDQRLLRMWAEGSGASMDWLMDMTDVAGIRVVIYQFPPPPLFNNGNEYYPQYLATHHYVVKFGSGEKVVVNCIMGNALKKGVVIHFKTRAKQLIRRGLGRVTGVIAQNAEGHFIQYNAKKAVVLCTGDYGSNPEMVAKYFPQAATFKARIPTSTGDGHQMAMRIGAVMERGPHALIMHGSAGPLGATAFLSVNTKGERFQNEDVPGHAYTNAVLQQPDQCAWQVFDSKYADELPYMGIGLGKVNKATDDSQEALAIQYNWIVDKQTVEKQSLKANTLEELANMMQVPVTTFKATVARYNELARMRKDLDFGKRADRLTTIDKPPFYAGKDRENTKYNCVLGGLNANDKLQALDRNFEVIPGLFLAGNTLGNFFGYVYPLVVPGISHGMCLHFGRVAGQNAATLD